MYSRTFERPISIRDKTSKIGKWQARKPVILARLLDASDENQINQDLLLTKGLFLANFGQLELEVFSSVEAAKSVWTAFEQQAACFVYQKHSFCQTWFDTVGSQENVQIHIVVVKSAVGDTLMIVPLYSQKGHFGTEVGFIGDGIADYMAPLIQDQFAETIADVGFDTLWTAILATFEQKIDLVWFDRQPANIGGAKNPFAQLKHFDYSSSSHALDFPDEKDWYHCARTLRSNKTAKKIERRLRQLAKQGDVELVEITEISDRVRHMRELLDLKIQNLNDAGILHRMDSKEIADFYLALVCDEATQGNLQQFELRCDGELVSSVFAMVHHDTFYYQVCAFNKGRFAQYSPGLLLLYQLFDWSFSRGIKRFDMTIGDEGYKDGWSNDTTSLIVAANALSVKGWLDYGFRRTKLAIKDFVKNSPRLRVIAMRVLKK